MQTIRDRITLYFTTNDFWGPRVMYERLAKVLPQGKAVWLSNEQEFTHAFVTEEEQCKALVPLTLAPLHILRSHL